MRLRGTDKLIASDDRKRQGALPNTAPIRVAGVAGASGDFMRLRRAHTTRSRRAEHAMDLFGLELAPPRVDDDISESLVEQLATSAGPRRLSTGCSPGR